MVWLLILIMRPPVLSFAAFVFGVFFFCGAVSRSPFREGEFFMSLKRDSVSVCLFPEVQLQLKLFSRPAGQPERLSQPDGGPLGRREEQCHRGLSPGQRRILGA